MVEKFGKITVENCEVDGVEIEGLKVISPSVFGDERGYFMETYNYNDFAAAGIDQTFVQDNQSSSKKGVLRGLHFQINYPQDKLVRVVNGEVFDVAVDLREGSKTYGKWFGVRLQRTRSSSSSRRILHMDLSYYLRLRNSVINVQISIIQMMKVACCGLILRLVLTGRCQKV